MVHSKEIEKPDRVEEKEVNSYANICQEILSQENFYRTDSSVMVRAGTSKNLFLLLVLVLALSITMAPFLVNSAFYGDEWPVFRRDPAHTGYTTTKALTTTPVANWTKLGGYQGVSSSPAVVDGVVYITAQSLYALNALTGEARACGRCGLCRWIQREHLCPERFVWKQIVELHGSAASRIRRVQWTPYVSRCC